MTTTLDADRRPRRSKRSRAGTLVRDLIVVVVIAITVSFLVKTFIVRSFYIPSGSMENTLQVNDRILVNQLQPRAFPLQRGDVVVFKDPGGWLPPPTEPDQGFWEQSSAALMSLIGSGEDTEEHLIKRVIGLPGDNVVCCDALGNLEINGQPIDEPYIVHSEVDPNAASLLFDVVVPEDSLWVMGDNRFNSKDSSKQQSQPGKGFVKIEGVVGRAIVVSWPMDRWAWLDNYPAVSAGID